MRIQAPENQCHEDMTMIRGERMLHEFEYECVVKGLIKLRLVAKSMYFAPNIATLGSRDCDDMS